MFPCIPFLQPSHVHLHLNSYTKNMLCPTCGNATRQEKQTGAVFVLNVLSEHEECRVCLDPGLKRQCCNNYYCDECYYKMPLCRSCNAPVGQKAENIFETVRVWPIIMGFIVSLFVAMIIAAGTFLALSNDATTPVGLFGYHCWGFFSQCNQYKCIQQDPGIANGSMTLGPLSQWTNCDLNSLGKIETNACVWDTALYESTKGLQGYDVCASQFIPGLYIFEDTFDAWKNSSVRSNKMKSGHWGKLQNARSNNWCGAVSGDRSLSLAGPSKRYIETKDMDLSTGGWLEAFVFMAPLGYDITNELCPTNYGGSVYIEYSNTRGKGNWTLLEILDPVERRQKNFFKVKYPMPAGTKYNVTRFRFTQPFFRDDGDAVAFDDVKVFKYFPPNWQQSPTWKQHLATAIDELQQLSCCFDTEWCQTRLTTGQMKQCSSRSPYYVASKYVIRMAEMFVAIAALVALIKGAYQSVQDLLMRRRFPFQDEVEDLGKVDRIVKMLPPRLRPRKRLEDYMANVHLSARLEADMQKEFADEEGTGEREKTRDELKGERAKVKARERKIKESKLKKMRKEREEKKIPEPSREELKLAAELQKPDEDDEEEEKNPQQEAPTFKASKVANDKDKLKRKDMSKLRTPFDTKVDLRWRQYCTWPALLLLGGIVLAKISTTNYFEIYQDTNPFGLYKSQIVLSSLFINFMSLVVDAKEVYSALKYVFAVRKDWVPMITVDTSEEIKSLFIGPHVIPLEDITEFNAFTPFYVKMLSAAVFAAMVPWSMILLILRDQYLPHDGMRYVTPAIGTIIILRGLLGPCFLAKTFFTFKYLSTTSFATREEIGRALQSTKTRDGAAAAAIAIGVLVTFFSAAVSVNYVPYVAPLSFVCGAAFGASNGCYHSLPIRPWMYLTCIDEGMWLRVKRKTKCPCKKVCIYCTDLHVTEEMFIIFPTDFVPFFNLIKSTTAAT